MKILIVALALLVSGCATNKEYAAYLAAQQSIAVQNTAATAAKATAIEKSMATGDATAKAVGMMALMMMQTPTVNVALPPQSEWLEAAKVFLPPLAYLGGTYIATDAAKFSAQMSRDVAMSTNSAFVGMGNQIAAGYPFIQAPGAVTNTTNTLSGTGVMGSGAYNPVSNAWTNSYNRNCAGGNGAGTTTGAPGGAANC